MGFSFFPGRKCWEVKACMTFDANQWVWHYISLKFPFPWTTLKSFFSKAFKGPFSISLIILRGLYLLLRNSISTLEDVPFSFQAYSKFHVGDRWRVRDVTNARLQIMWSWHRALPPSREKENGNCRLSGVSVGSMAVEWRLRESSLGRHHCRDLWGNEQWRRRFVWRSCFLRVWDFSTTCCLWMFCWSQCGCAERFRSHVWTFCVTSCLSQLPVRRTCLNVFYHLSKRIILFISDAACKWNHWQVLFINDEVITREMGAHRGAQQISIA